MRRLFTASVIALALSALSWPALAAGTQAMGASWMLGLGAHTETGDVLDPFGGGTWSQNGVGLHARGGSADRTDKTLFGAHIGWRWGLRGGLSGADGFGAGDDWFAVGQLEGAARIFTFNVPFEGCFVVHGGGELSKQPAWWNDGWSASALVGVGLVTAPASFLRFEVDYTWQPASIQEQANDATHDVARSEHRVTVSAAVGPIGVGGRFVTASQTDLFKASVLDSVSSTRMMAFVEYRGGD